MSDPRIEELGDTVTAGDLEREPDAHDGGKGNASAPNHPGHEQGDGDRDDGRGPLDSAPEKSCPIGGEQERWKDPGQEEHEGIQQGDGAKARGGLAEQIGRQSRRHAPGVRMIRAGA